MGLPPFTTKEIFLEEETVTYQLYALIEVKVPAWVGEQATSDIVERELERKLLRDETSDDEPGRYNPYLSVAVAPHADQLVPIRDA